MFWFRAVLGENASNFRVGRLSTREGRGKSREGGGTEVGFGLPASPVADDGDVDGPEGQLA